MPSTTPTDRLASVQDRYGAAAEAVEAELCCPVDYDPQYLKAIPAEVIERDYGCGDPSRLVRPGDIVLDLGSGGGKICFIASQVAGPEGRVIGVDATPAMLDLARSAGPKVGAAIGYENVEFRRGHIEDLSLDLDALEPWLAANPVSDVASLERLAAEQQRLRRTQPLIADASVDLIVSNCVLNLVAAEQKAQLFAEIARVLKPGGRAAISDIVAEVDVPQALQDDPEHWSGCISGALREDRFLDAFREVGLVDVEFESYATEPWRVVEGIAFRSVTVLAHRPPAGCGQGEQRGDAVTYRGPFASVTLDGGQVLERAKPTEVGARTFQRLQTESLAKHVVARASDGSVQADSDAGCC